MPIDSGSIRKRIFKFGHGHNLAISDLPTDLWEGSAGLYPFQDNAVKLYVSSSEASDVGIPLLLEGLDENGFIQQKVVILNGQTQVEIDGMWYRQYRALNADSGVLFAGHVYVAEQDSLTGGVPDTASKIKVHIEPEFQQTQMVIYTTPVDYEAKMSTVFVSLVPKTTATAYAKLGMYMRVKGGGWKNQAYMGLITSGTSAIQLNMIEEAGVIAPLTDIVIRAMDLSANDSEITAFFTLKFTRKIK